MAKRHLRLWPLPQTVSHPLNCVIHLQHYGPVQATFGFCFHMRKARHNFLIQSNLSVVNLFGLRSSICLATQIALLNNTSILTCGGTTNTKAASRLLVRFPLASTPTVPLSSYKPQRRKSRTQKHCPSQGPLPPAHPAAANIQPLYSSF